MAQTDGPPAYSLPIHAAEQLRAAGRELALAGDHEAALAKYTEAAAAFARAGFAKLASEKLGVASSPSAVGRASVWCAHRAPKKRTSPGRRAGAPSAPWSQAARPPPPPKPPHPNPRS